jgi:hypothetical protein
MTDFPGSCRNARSHHLIILGQSKRREEREYPVQVGSQDFALPDG